MIPTHHLKDETLQDYAAGTLDVPMETLVACHLTSCRNCREREALADKLGGMLFADYDSVSVTMTAHDLLASATSAMPPSDRPAINTPAAGVPRPLGRLLPNEIDSLNWRWMAPGIQQFDLGNRDSQGGAFKLLQLSPGATLMEHGHTDRELTYVVRGSYSDETGQYRTGDIADLDSGIEHSPVIDSAIPCIALIATQAPVRYKRLLGRMFQPFVGI